MKMASCFWYAFSVCYMKHEARKQIKYSLNERSDTTIEHT